MSEANPTSTAFQPKSPVANASGATYGGKDRRQFPRRIFLHGIGILYRGEYLLALGSEIGEGGISFQIGYALDLGQQLVVTFCLPGFRFLSLRVEIKNRKKHGSEMLYGCSYVDISFEIRRKIRSFVAHQKK